MYVECKSMGTPRQDFGLQLRALTTKFSVRSLHDKPLLWALFLYNYFQNVENEKMKTTEINCFSSAI